MCVRTKSTGGFVPDSSTNSGHGLPDAARLQAGIFVNNVSRENKGFAQKNVFLPTVFRGCKSLGRVRLSLLRVLKNYVVRAQATSPSTAAAVSGDGLPDTGRLRAEAAVRGSACLTSGQRRTKAQLLMLWSNLCVLLPTQRHGFPKNLFVSTVA